MPVFSPLLVHQRSLGAQLAGDLHDLAPLPTSSAAPSPIQPPKGTLLRPESAQSPRGSCQSVNTQELCSPVHYPLDEPRVFQKRNTLDFKALKGEEERVNLPLTLFYIDDTLK